MPKGLCLLSNIFALQLYSHYEQLLVFARIPRARHIATPLTSTTVLKLR
jgi:hypothetical protein